MIKASVQRSVRFDRHQYEQFEQLAASQERTISDLVRIAIARFLADAKRETDSHVRHLHVSEYAQIALDWIIQQDHPEVRDELIAQAKQRMDRHHGA